jgi:hypothetical protein
MRKMSQHVKDQSGTPLASLLGIHPRYMRSVHLERDFSDTTSSLGYVLTPLASDAISRICAGFRPDSTQRAFRISGDYGSGKSAFGLALARISAGNTRALPKELHPFCQRIRVHPHLATGDHEPLGVTVLRALGVKLSRGSKPTTDEVLSKVKKAIGQARVKGYKGVLLVLDELGKNLEFAAQNPESDDIFLLQRLAEEAARSGDQPLIVVVMLHQGVAAYAAGLDSTARREWDKVAGRFEEIIYSQPLEQFVTLVAATLSVNLEALPDAIADECTKAMIGAIRSGNETNQRGISKAIKEMKGRGVLYERGAARGLCLWPHTSVNLDEEFKRGYLATQSGEDSIELLCRQLPPEQIVPRGHYLRSGTLRYGEVKFIPATALTQLLAAQPALDGKGPDLNLRVLLPASQLQFRNAEKYLRTHHENLSEGLFVAIAQPPTNGAAALSWASPAAFLPSARLEKDW